MYKMSEGSWTIPESLEFIYIYRSSLPIPVGLLIRCAADSETVLVKLKLENTGYSEKYNSADDIALPAGSSVFIPRVYEIALKKQEQSGSKWFGSYDLIDISGSKKD
jgi:hypothetical protein